MLFLFVLFITAIINLEPYDLLVFKCLFYNLIPRISKLEPHISTSYLIPRISYLVSRIMIKTFNIQSQWIKKRHTQMSVP